MDDKYQHELSAEEFLDSSDMVIERVETPEAKPGSFVYVRSLTAAERGKIEENGAKFKEKVARGKDHPFARDFSVTFAFLCMCDANGNRKFDDIKFVEKLRKKNSGMIARIAEAGQRLSGFSKEDMEELEKNSKETQEDDSPSD